MEIIKTYLDNLFSSLPKTKEVLKMKEDLLINMEDKYRELKAEGKTENEAIGIVISEFGNIEELANELNIDITTDDNGAVLVTEEVVSNYVETVKKTGNLIGLGVLLVIFAPAVMIFLYTIGGYVEDEMGVLGVAGLIALLILVAIGVGLFIYSGFQLKDYEYLKDEIIVPTNIKENLKKEKKKADSKFTLGLVVSIIMYILSPIILFVFYGLNTAAGYDKYSYQYGVCILLIIVAIATFTIIRLAMPLDSYNVLLKLENYSKKSKKKNKLIDSIAGVYWPLVTIAYLLWSFLGDSWHISWIIWAIAGVVFGAISSLIQAMTKDDN